ncbi:MAG TPA: hypothetical protein VLJ17_15220 [Xanthobacteraceae bacterium]|nr:hypothetical protein [Xanthobacteraceae bacterium]
MYAAKEGNSTLGIPQSIGKEFIAASHGIKDLPKRVKDGKPVKRKRDFGSLAP